ncbi:GAF domain-containing protein [Aeromonas salmonicida]|uniref:GAF domain-containing protein n=1 Tax=Aeromonas salmonicida TaxID=645 RepID=UPI0039A52C2E
MDHDRIEAVLKKNRYINASFTGHFISLCSIWNTLIAPIIIGFGVSYIFAFKDNPSNIHGLFYVISIIVMLIHIILALGFYYLDKRSDTSQELSELAKKYNQISDDMSIIRQRLHSSTELATTQNLVIYLSTLKVNSHIRDLIHDETTEETLSIESMENRLQDFFDTILNYLSIHREVLFNFVSESRYNIALYIYDQESKELEVVSRRCDDRIHRKNRRWKPGFGHVGLTYIHKELKICPDITKSNELKISDSSDKKNYCSFISVPIITYNEDNEDNECLGVLVLTSAIPEQFSLGRDKSFLQNISSLMAIYLDVAIKIYKDHNNKK